ncbi:hypothetical protein, partial [Vaccinium witches'-broom phytoplasma]|uniref:hypothetical protein n=1 Tax=Vaccinium witches'-broom phytoplasma TaxID=85642 RepID=UPI000571668A
FSRHLNLLLFNFYLNRKTTLFTYHLLFREFKYEELRNEQNQSRKTAIYEDLKQLKLKYDNLELKRNKFKKQLEKMFWTLYISMGGFKYIMVNKFLFFHSLT